MIIDELKNKHYFMKGKRGYIYTAIYKNKKVAIKKKNPNSKATARIANEAKWLLELNDYNIGPKLLESTSNYIIYEFVEGKFIVTFFKEANKKEILKVIDNLFKQMRQLDKLMINKEEMHHPFKHVLINNKKVTLIDFERCRKTKKPKNITQFCQFLISKNLTSVFKNKKLSFNREEIINIAKKYKNSPNERNFNKIIKKIGI